MMQSMDELTSTIRADTVEGIVLLQLWEPGEAQGDVSNVWGKKGEGVEQKQREKKRWKLICGRLRTI